MERLQIIVEISAIIKLIRAESRANHEHFNLKLSAR